MLLSQTHTQVYNNFVYMLFSPSLYMITLQFVVAGGASGRMGAFAELIARELGHPEQDKEKLNIAKTDRFAFFKIGPVLSISVSGG